MKKEIGINFDDYLNEEFEKNPKLKDLYEKEHLNFIMSQEIKKIRQKRKYSQLELAKRAGTTQSVVARIESGNSNISLTTLSKILTGLGAKIKIEI